MRPLDLALDAALLVMRSGGSTVAAQRAFGAILKGTGQPESVATWRLDFIAAADGASTIVRPVGPIGVNLVRAAEVAMLSERVAKGEVAAPALASELERIAGTPSPYSPWLQAAAAAAAAACFSRLVAGDWGSFAIVFVAAGVGQTVRSQLQRRGLAAAPVTLACGLLSALIAAAGLKLGFSRTVPATAIASIIYMAPGLPLINGFIDMASHRHLLIGFERMLNAAYLFLVLAIALAVAAASFPR